MSPSFDNNGGHPITQPSRSLGEYKLLVRRAVVAVREVLAVYPRCFHCGLTGTRRGRITFVRVCDRPICNTEACKQIDEGHAKNPDSSVPKETITPDGNTAQIRAALWFLESMGAPEEEPATRSELAEAEQDAAALVEELG